MKKDNFSNVSVLIGLALTIGFLSWARVIVTPLALAILLTFLLSPIVIWLQRYSVPRILAVVLAASLALSIVIAAAWSITIQITSLVDSYPKYEENILSKIHGLYERDQDGFLDKLQGASERITEQVSDKQVEQKAITANEKEIVQPVRIVEEGPFRFSQIWSIIGPMLEPIANAGFVIVLVCFMLINREDLRDRVIKLIGVDQIANTTRALEDAGERVSRYLLMQLLINSGYGLGIAIGLWFIGVPYAALWGFFGALLRYIPYLGPWLAAILPIMLSLLISPDWSIAIMVAILFGMLELLTNIILEPLIYGRGIGVSQAALLISVAFWTWLWGPIGLILASPLTVCIVVLGRYVPYLNFIDTLLGDQPTLSSTTRFYQRLLAGDGDEASRIMELEIENDNLAFALDTLAVSALVQARLDLRNHKIDSNEQRELIDDLRVIIADQDSENNKDKAVMEENTVSASRIAILAIPARDKTDELAVTMLSKLAQDDIHFNWYETHSAAMVSDTLALIEQIKPDMVSVVAIHPGNLTHTIYLCKRIRDRFPQMFIMVCRYGYKEGELSEVDQNKIQTAGANRIAHNLNDSISEFYKLNTLDKLVNLDNSNLKVESNLNL
ncbi:putative PurR-regulated permease PerM [Nitrosomonas sp. Nm84]|uniref:AI-2E family transporter n=1 Tax=Nitrosomonas sp. Nm84 TaxID=200124 RepID=UPI000D7727CE|nr:AI-2E family transporter [Nitrosomonas sp. Nm84]PXW91376.1 putative PurR-regulated permease PerM [Nitrosomonas sp. Nm84]